MARPLKKFHDFIGQTRVINFLRPLINGARACGDACASLLLVGPAGIGKTTFAKAIAAEYGSDLHCLFADKDLKPSEICAAMRELSHGDVLLIDEGHSLSRDAQQILFRALDERKIPVETNRGISRSENESVAEFTLVIATTEPGGVRSALRNRLTRVEFDPYTQNELKEIAKNVATDHGLELSSQALNLLAQVAQGSPRVIGRRIENLKHFFSEKSSLSKADVRKFLACEGIDNNGFTPHQRIYLKYLASLPEGQCSQERLTIRLGCDPANVRQEIEPYLFEKNFVAVSSRSGRVMTEKGRQIVAGFTEFLTFTRR